MLDVCECVCVCVCVCVTAESAIADAKFNAELNGITNASFVCGDLQRGLQRPGKVTYMHTNTHTRIHTHTHTARTRADARTQTHAHRYTHSMHTLVERRQSAHARTCKVLCVVAYAHGCMQDQSNNADKSGVATAWQRPNVVVVNPARAGLSEAVVDYLQRCGARRVVYVSCNPATQARDLRRLCGVDDTQRGSQRFRLTSVQPVDMFPHTDHVENVAVLDRAL